MIGKEFDTGLANLKAVAESKRRVRTTRTVSC
jgi:hypothetical protein